MSPTDATANDAPGPSTGMVTDTYTVAGMTCGHCVNAVSTELASLPGVANVEVDLDTGGVTVSSEAPLDRAAVAAAVEEAGYELTSAGWEG